MTDQPALIDVSPRVCGTCALWLNPHGHGRYWGDCTWRFPSGVLRLPASCELRRRVMGRDYGLECPCWTARQEATT